MSKLRGAIIGFGNVAALGHWPGYEQSEDFEIVAVVDPSEERRQAALQLRPTLKTFSSAEDLLQSPTGDRAPTFKDKGRVQPANAGLLDFVDICTPPASHAKLAQAGVQRGWHVLCEKPLSLYAGDYTLLARHVQKSEKTVFAVHNWKYAPIFQKAFEILQQGRIGPVWHVELFVLRDTHCKGTAQGVVNTSAPKPAEDWRTNREVAGGGILVDHGWHQFYLLLNLVKENPERILAKMQLSAEDKNSLEQEVQALVQFPNADAYIHLTWKAKMRRNSAVIQGESGTLLLDDDRLLLTTHSGEREEIRFDTALSGGSHHTDWFKKLLPDFLAEIREPAKRGVNFREAGWCVGLTRAAYESNLHGFQEVDVSFPGIARPAPALT